MTEIQQAPLPFHFLRKAEVLAAIGISKSTFHAWINEGKFPKPVYPFGATRPLWVSTEVAAWMAACVTERDANQPLAA